VCVGEGGGIKASRREDREQFKTASMHASVQRTDFVSMHEWCIYAGSRAILRLVMLGQGAGDEEVGQPQPARRTGCQTHRNMRQTAQAA